MVLLPEKKKGKTRTKKELDIEQEVRDEIKKEFKDRISILAVAYHNLAVEQEFLKLYSESIQSYSQARAFALKYLGAEDEIFKNLD
jgi:hypothetical protein